MSQSSSTNSTPKFAIPGISVKNKYDEVFELEVEAWCYGLAKFPGELTSILIHRVIKEMSALFKGAIQHYYVFNLEEVAALMAQAGRNLVEPRELAFAILVNLPAPFDLDEDAQFVLAQVVDQAERNYGGVLERLEKRWRGEQQKRKKAPATKVFRKPGAEVAPHRA